MLQNVQYLPDVVLYKHRYMTNVQLIRNFVHLFGIYKHKGNCAFQYNKCCSCLLLLFYKIDKCYH